MTRAVDGHRTTRRGQYFFHGDLLITPDPVIAGADMAVDAEALQAVEIGGTPVKAFAEQKGLTATNAGVRVFRAREALKKRVTESCATCAEHGCVDCTCKRR